MLHPHLEENPMNSHRLLFAWLLVGVAGVVIGHLLPLMSLGSMTMLTYLTNGSLDLQRLGFIAIIAGSLISVWLVFGGMSGMSVQKPLIAIGGIALVVGLLALVAFWNTVNGLGLVRLEAGFFIIGAALILQLIVVGLLFNKKP